MRIENPLGTCEISCTSNGQPVPTGDIRLFPISPRLPSGMMVDSCLAALVEFEATPFARTIVFSCSVVGEGLTSGTETGEGLFAQSWQSSTHILVVGTEDDETVRDRCLIHRVKVEGSPGQVQVTVDLPPALAGFSLHYVLAWNPAPEPKELSCWFAVDRPHTELTQLAR